MMRNLRLRYWLSRAAALAVGLNKIRAAGRVHRDLAATTTVITPAAKGQALCRKANVVD
jgi:hypothetical protein